MVVVVGVKENIENKYKHQTENDHVLLGRDEFHRHRSILELGCEFLGRVGHVRLHVLRVGALLLDLVAVVHGPPDVILEPVARAVVVHIDDALADSLALLVIGDHLDIEVLLLVLGVLHQTGIDIGLFGDFRLAGHMYSINWNDIDGPIDL